MEAEEFSSWAPVVADVLFYTYYWIIALVIGSIAACCVSATIRTACIAKVVALVLWRLESKQVRGSRRGSVVFKNADGFVCVQHVDWCNLLSPQDAAALCKNLPYEVIAFRIESLRFRVPNLSRWKFELVVDGCDVQIRQKAMPTQGRQRKVPRAANPGVLKEKARRLALVDMLLWDFNPVTESSRESKCSGRTHAWLASVVHAIVSICMRAVSCHLTDIKLMLFQDTVPGPWQSAAPSAGNCGHREGISCHVRVVSQGPVEVRGSSSAVAQRNKRMAMHENAWFKTFVPAPVSDVLASVDQRRQVQLSVEGVSVSVHSTFKLGSTQQQGGQSQFGGLNASTQAAATTAQPPVSATGASTASAPKRKASNRHQGLGTTTASSGHAGRSTSSTATSTTHMWPVDTSTDTSGDRKGQNSKCSYLEWQIDQPILQNWGCSISLLSTPAKPRRDQSKATASNGVPPKRAGAADSATKLAPEDSMHGSVSPVPFKSMNRDIRRTSFLARIPESAERAKVSNSFVGLPSPAVHSHFRTRSSLIQRSSTAVHYLPARTPGTMGPLRGAISGGPSFKHVFSERGESSAESAAAELDKAEEPPEGCEPAEDAESDSGTHTLLHVEVKLRALVPTADAHTLAVLSRVALRTHLYSAMEANWAARPKTRVKTDPRAWWRHAALRVLQECSRVRRRRTALFVSLRQHRIHKRYRVLYLRLHENNASFRDPNRKWWQVWKFFLRAREPSLSLAREELGLLDQDLPLEEIIYLRMKCAMNHSDHLKDNAYASRLMQILNMLKINPHEPLHPNEEAIMRGKPVLPPLASSSIPVKISASVTIPRVGFSIHVERPEPCILSGEISKCCATLHTTARFLFTVETAVLQTRVQPAGMKSPESPWGTVLLQAPCASFALLHHSDPDGMLRGRRSANSTAPQPFLLISFKPPGVAETQAEIQAHIRNTDTLPGAKRTALSKSVTFNGLPEYGELTPVGSINEDQVHLQQDEKANGGFSTRASMNLSDMSNLRDSIKTFQQYDAAERTQALVDRIERLRGDVVFGSGLARMAPVEAFVDSSSLVCLLELGLQLRTLIHDGDCLMKQVAGCGSTVQGALSGGTLPALVHGSLVKHRIAVQGMSPPVFPSLSVTWGGLVLRLGMLGQSDKHSKAPDTQQQPPSPHSIVDPHPDNVHPGEYEFIVSVIDVSGFKQGSISSLLQEVDLSQIKEVHEAAVLSWMHPADDEAILRSLRDKQSSNTEYISQDKKLAIKEMFPHLMLDPGDGAFPLLPTFKIAGTAIRCTCVMPVAPSVAGNLNLAATGRPNGISISISPDHLKLIRHLVKDVDDVFKSVQDRASSIISTDQASNGNRSQAPGLAAPKATEQKDATQRVSKAFRGSQSLAGNKHVTVALHVPIVTVLFFAPRSGDNADARCAQWVRGVLDSGSEVYWSPQARDAAMWADQIAPMADITVVDLRIGADLRGAGSGSACATVGGCLLTDLQVGTALPDSTLGGGIRFGPLPFRAQNLLAKATRERHHMCGLQPPTRDFIAVQKSAHADLQAPLTMRGGERPETSRGRDRGRSGSDALAAAAAIRPLSALSGPVHRMGISEISNCRSSVASRGWAAVRRSIFTSAAFRQRWLQYWLNNRCALLLKSQVELTPTQDNSFTQWHHVYDKAMRVGSDSLPQMRVSVVAWADGQNDQNDHPGLQVDASVALQQMHMVGILQGNSRMTCYVAQLLEVVVPTLGRKSTKPPKPPQAQAPAAPPSAAAARAHDRLVVSNCAAAPMPMQISVSFGVAAMQGTLRAGKKGFLESLTRDASCTVRLTIDPETAPAGELEVDAWAADVRVQHATDILHKDVLRMPAPQELVGAVSSAAAHAVPQRRAGSEADGGDGYSSSDEADPPLPVDVCIHLAGKQQLFFEGAALCKSQPKSLWTVQAHKPMATFQLHFLYDILYIIQHVRGKYRDHFSKLHPCPASPTPTPAHAPSSPQKVPTGPDVSGEPEIQPAAACADGTGAAWYCTEPSISPKVTNSTAVAPLAGSLKTRSTEFPFEIQVVLTQGAVILPERISAEPGQERACIVSCDRVVLGLPGATLNPITTGVTMDAGVMGDAAARSTMLPHVSSLLPSSARTLNRHCAMTQVVHDDVPSDSDHDTDAAESHEHDDDTGEQVEGTGRIRNWLRKKFKDAIGIVENTLHNANTPSHAAAAKNTPDATPTAKTQPVQVADVGAQTSGVSLDENANAASPGHLDAHGSPAVRAAGLAHAGVPVVESSPNDMNMCQRAFPVKTHVKFSESCTSTSNSPFAAVHSHSPHEDVNESGSPAAAAAAASSAPQPSAAAGAREHRSDPKTSRSSKRTHRAQIPMPTGLDTESQALVSFIAQGYQIHGCHVAKRYCAATSPQKTPGRSRSGAASSSKSSPGSTPGHRHSRGRVGHRQYYLTYKRLVPVLTKGNLGFAFTLRQDNACHIHLSSSPVWVCLSPASYHHIIDMCTGNFLEGSRLNPLPIPPFPTEFREFRPRVRMWPAASSRLLTTVTVTAARGSVVLQADSCIWEDGAKAGPIYSAPRVPFAQVESTDFALSVVVAVNKNKRIETFILADVQSAHTYDLRLARFHLLRKPWMGQATCNSIPEEAPPANGGLNGRMPSIPQDEEVSGGAHFPPRSPSKVGASGRGGSVAQGSVTMGGGYEGSRGGENGESTPPPLIYMDDLYNTGVLYTSLQGKEYSSVLSGIDRLPGHEQSEMATVPLVHLGSAPVFHRHARSNWAAHLPDDYTDTAALSCGFCVLGDRTMALDLDLRHFQTMWPWLVEISMLTSVLSIFVPAERFRKGAVIPRIQPWFYINVVLEHFQALVPLTKDVLEVDGAVTQNNSLPGQEDPSRTGSSRGEGPRNMQNLVSLHMAQERVSKAVMERPGVFQLMAQAMLNRLADTGDLKPLYRYRRDSSQTLFGSPFLTDTPGFLKGMNGSRAGQRSPGQFQRPAQLILPAEEGSTVCAPEKVPSRAFMDSAIIFTTHAIRYGQFFGDDGKTIMKLDVWNACSHVSHPDACVECWLLPCSLEVELHERTRLVEEQRRLQLMTEAAIKIQRWWRQKKIVLRLKQRDMLPNTSGYGDLDRADSESMVATWGATSRLGSHGALIAVPPESTRIIDDLIYRRLSPADRARVDKLHKQQQSTLDLGLPREPCEREVKVKLHNGSVRVAISHLSMHRLVRAHFPVMMNALTGLPSKRQPPTTSVVDAAEPAQAFTTGAFRQTTSKVHISIDEASLWLCMDGSQSFGAPDVMQASLNDVVATSEIELTQADVAPTVRAMGSLRACMRFLDNSTSNWQWMLCPWMVTAEYLYARPNQGRLTDNEPAQVMSIDSRQNAIILFTPACLLTIGDVLAYVNALMRENDKNDIRNTAAAFSTTQSVIMPGYQGYKGRHQRPPRPDMREQMALSMQLTERLPQRYCIQNRLGISCWYWTPSSGPHATMTKHELPPGDSQQMRCDPRQKEVIMEQAEGGRARKKMAVISLLAEGNWLPVSNVVVGQVGKYRYSLYSPHDNATVYIVADIQLVGRTKVVSLHSSVWLENGTDVPFKLRLHVPPSLLVVAPQQAMDYEYEGSVRTESVLSPAPSASSLPKLSRNVGPTPVPGSSRSLGAGASGSLGQTPMHAGLSGNHTTGLSRRASSRRLSGPGATAREWLLGASDINLRTLLPSEGIYLPLAAMLNGTVYFTPEGHHENMRDVLRIKNDLSQLHSQQGYLQCRSATPVVQSPFEQGPDGPSPPPPAAATLTHFFMKVSANKAHEEHSAALQFTQVSVDSSGFHPAHFRPVKATETAIVANVTLQPTCVFTNALPFPAKVTFIEAWYEKNVPQGKDAQKDPPAHTNTPTFVSKVKNASVMADSWSMGLPREQSLVKPLLDSPSPIHAHVVAGQKITGRHVQLSMDRGAAVNLYADQNRTILAYMEVPYINMHTDNWFVVNWGLADLGPLFDPLRMYAHRTRRAAVTGAPPPKKPVELPRLLHLVPYVNDVHERRRRVFRRLRNFITRGVCIGGDLPPTMQSRSTATRTSTVQSNGKDNGKDNAASTQIGTKEAPSAAGSKLLGQVGADGTVQSNRLRSQALTVAQSKSTLLEEEGDHTDAHSDASDAEYRPRLKSRLTRSLSQSRSIAGALQEEDTEASRTSKRMSGSRGTDSAIPRNLPGEIQNVPREDPNVDSESEMTSVMGSPHPVTRACPLAQTPRRRLLMSAFEAWRYAKVSKGQRAPQSLYLGVANSGRARNGQLGRRHSCEITVYSYYWVVNSSRSPLYFWDVPQDSSSDFLDSSSMMAPGSVYAFNLDGKSDNELMLLPCLLNRQTKVRFCVPAHYTSGASRLGEASWPINISVVGLQSDKISLKGPEFPRPTKQQPVVTKLQTNPTVVKDDDVSRVASLVHSPGKGLTRVPGDSPGLPEGSRSSVIAGGSISVGSVPSGTSIATRTGHHEGCGNLIHKGGANSAPVPRLRSSDAGGMSAAAAGMSISLRFPGDPLHIETPTDLPTGDSSFGFLTSPSVTSRSPASRATPGASLARTSTQAITPRMGQSLTAPSSAPTLASGAHTSVSTRGGEDLAEVTTSSRIASPANGAEQPHLFQSAPGEDTPQGQHKCRSSFREELREELLHERELQERTNSGRSAPPPQVQAEFSGTGSHNTSDGHTASTPLESWLQARPTPREWLNGASNATEFISSVPSTDVSILQTDELLEAEPSGARLHSPADRAPDQGVTLASAAPAVLAEVSPESAATRPPSSMLRRTPSNGAAISAPTYAVSRSSSTENVPSSLTAPFEAVFSPISPNGQQKSSPKAKPYPRRAPSPLRETSSLAGSSNYSPRSPLETQGAVSTLLSSRDKAQSTGSRPTAAQDDLTLRSPAALRIAQRDTASRVQSLSSLNGTNGAIPSVRSTGNLSDRVSPPAVEASLRHPSEASPASVPPAYSTEIGSPAPGAPPLAASDSTSAFAPDGPASPYSAALVALQASRVSEIQPAASTQSLQRTLSNSKKSAWPVYGKICRQHEFAVEVVSGSAHSCFSFTKMVHIKDKYIIENRTGEVLEIKQRTTPDPGMPFGPEGIKRSACQLPDGASTAFFWDDNTAPKSVVARLASDGPGQWEWSGGFALAEKEDYLGLRMHHTDAAGMRDGQTVIVPVSIAVDSSKVVLVSFKSRQNLPPYKIRNSCAAVDIIVSQQVDSARPERLIPGKEVPFAWDEPMLGHKLVVTAVLRNSDPDPESHRATTVLEIDKGMPSKIAPLVVKARAGRRTTGTELTAQNRSNSTQDLKSRFNLEGALARSVERKVQIEIFADGPTRIVRCSDTDTTSALEGTVVSTMHRIHDAEHRLLVTNQRFAALRGGNSISRLDLFGAAERRTGVGAFAPAQDWPTPRASVPALTEFSPARPAENPLGPSSEANSPQHPSATALVAAGSVSTAVAMMTAGNLLVTVHGLREKDGGNLLVRLAVGDQKQQTNVHWGCDETHWNEEINFYQVDAAKVLHAEVRDVIGRYSNIKSKHDPEKVLEKSSVFVGEARVPLAETLPGFMTRTSNTFGADNSDGGENSTVKREFVLARRHGGDLVSGYITLSFEWTITAASLLKQKLRVLEQVLTTRNEILSILAPRPIERTEISHNLTGSRGPGALARTSNAGSFDECKSRRADDSKWTLEARRRYFDVNVSVLEVHNVPPRKGLGAAITANDAPLPSVTVSVGSQKRSWVADTRGTQATFRTVRHTFENVPARTDLKVTVYDHVSSSAPEPHGVAKIPLNGLDLTNPVYMWLEAPACKEDIDLRQSRAHNAMFRAVSDGAGAVKAALGVGLRGVQPESFELEEAPVEHIQLRVRLEAVPLDTAGPSLAANLRLAGGGIILSSGLDEELLASSFSDLQVTLELGQSEASIHATIQTLQIDDQSLDAQQPVVLGPASAVSKGLNRLGDHAKHPVAYGLLDPGNLMVGEPLVRLTLIRSFAHNPSDGHSDLQRSPGLKAQRGHQALVGGMGSGNHLLDPMTSVNEVYDSASPASSIGSILSFKQVSLELGSVDFTAHENFLTSVFNFAQQLPLEDISQDEEWQKRTREAINSIEVGYTAKRVQQAVLASQQQLAELAAYHRPTGRNDSVLGSWFFIEKFTISNIHSNVTINLSSNIVAKAQLLKVQAGVDADGRDRDDPSVETSIGLGSQFLHLVQNSGFQLINVNNVAIQLKGKELHSSLLSTKSLIAMLIRHYFEQAVMEAHKVLGGTGPAIAQIPLTVLWTGGTLFDLTVDLASRRAGALSALPRMGFITFTASAQLIGVASKMAAAFLAVLPYYREGDYSDAAAVARYVVRPQHAVEAFSMATKALFQGLAAAMVGVVSDPYAGFKHGNVPGLAVGTAKGILGLGLRPLGGFSEFCSKSSQGLALVCLGRQGIQGRTMRRVYAPGISRRLHGEQEAQSVELESQLRQRRMWEQTLPQLSPKFSLDALLYAVTVRRGRVLLLSDRHVIYCKARYYSPETFRLRWYLDVENINNVLGDEGKLTVLVRAASVVQLPCAGTWRFPVTKKIRAASLEIFEKVATELNDQVTVPQFSRHSGGGDMWSASHHLPQLRITAGNDISRTSSAISSDNEGHR